MILGKFSPVKLLVRAQAQLPCRKFKDICYIYYDGVVKTQMEGVVVFQAWQKKTGKI